MSSHIVVVGGVAGGASAAAKARRESEEARITVVEAGAVVSWANCGLPYWIEGAIPRRETLLLNDALLNDAEVRGIASS